MFDENRLPLRDVYNGDFSQDNPDFSPEVYLEVNATIFLIKVKHTTRSWEVTF